MIEPFRIHVTQAGAGFLAENRELSITVGGASAADAAEKARAVAYEVLRGCIHEQIPATVMARIDECGSIAFVSRPFKKPFSLSHGDPDTFYVDSHGGSVLRKRE